jgi:DNA-binding CsgD family transcriptional regulator
MFDLLPVANLRVIGSAPAESGVHSSFVVSLVAVRALATRDAERLLRFVAEAESLGRDQPFTSDFLAELGHLVTADVLAYNELDRVRRRNLLLAVWPDENDDEDDEISDEDWALQLEHPVCHRHQQGFFEALKLSDFLTQRELHRTRLYDRRHRPWGIEYEMCVAIPSPLWHTKTFLFFRTGSRDFSERDRLLLNLLQPHLARLWQAARTRRLLKSVLGELDRVDEEALRAVILLGSGSEVEYASPPTERLLHTFFPATNGARLPAALAEWLQSDGTEPLIRRRGTLRLTIKRADGALLLEERQEEVRLTRREREVLGWVARGKTNAEIAQLLWLAPSTVRKHLENVYAKLGVSTRTAAVAHFLGLVDAERS